MDKYKVYKPLTGDEPVRWTAPTDEAETTETTESGIEYVWANSLEEAKRMSKMSYPELQAYLRERDGEERANNE